MLYFYGYTSLVIKSRQTNIGLIISKQEIKVKRFYVLMISFLTIYFCSCQNQNTQKQDMQVLKETISRFYAAIEEGNSEKRFELFSKNALMMPNNSDIVILNDSVKNTWSKWDDEWIFRIMDLEQLEIELSGVVAYSVNSYYYTWHYKDDEPEWHKTKNVHIWRKQTDGSWKLHLDIWNSSERVE